MFVLFWNYSFSFPFPWSHRVLRHTVFICASRSLSVQASACRSSIPSHHNLDNDGGGGTLIFIDVENLNTVRCTVHNTYNAVKINYLSLSKIFYFPCFATRVIPVCVSSTSFRCPALVNSGTSTSVSIQPKKKVIVAHQVMCVM